MKSVIPVYAIAAVVVSLFAEDSSAQQPRGGVADQAAHAAQATPKSMTVASPTAAVATKTSLHDLPAPTALESQAGIQIAQVGLTAQGGMVDVRFKVLDAAKAKALLGNPANAPMLIAGNAPPLHPPHHALKGARFAAGQVFYILYPNARGAVRPGVEVTVAMGDARLGPIKAQ